MPAKSKKRSDYSLARDIAQRLVKAGVQPFKDDRTEYVRLHGKREGEVYVFGPRLRSHRMFSMKRRAEVERTAQDFAAFAAGADQTDWRVWTAHYPSRKTELDALVEDLQSFNSLINNVFSELRKRKDCNFEMLFLGIHIEFDHSIDLFDIHAHFVCKMPADDREELRRRLMMAFSRTDLSDEPLRSAQGFARYAEKTLKLDHVVTWPIEALKGVWPLVDHKFQYVRTGGDFAAWRNENKKTTPKVELEEKRRKRKNRHDTRYEGNAWDYRDKPQVRKKWKLGGELLDGTLYLSAPTATPKRTAPSAPPSSYPSALGTITQSTAIFRETANPEPVAEKNNFGLAGSSSRVVGIATDPPVSLHAVSLQPVQNPETAMPLTEKAIHEAAHKLNRDGLQPTQRQVRKLLGTGSFTTIAAALKTFKPDEEPEKTPEPAPADVESYGKLLAAYAYKMAVDKADMIASERIEVFQANVRSTEKDIAAITQTADELAIDNDKLRGEVNALKSRIAKLSVAADTNRKNCIAAEAKAQALEGTIKQLMEAISGQSAAEGMKPAA
jgi:regulator of replication initiation timing